MGKATRKASDLKSLQGKRPVNKAKLPKRNNTTTTTPTASSMTLSNGNFDSRKMMRNPGHILNRLKRSEVYGKYLQEKKRRKKELRLQRLKQVEALGEEEDADDDDKPKKQTPKTLDNTREIDPTSQNITADEEIMADEAEDEFAPYFSVQRNDTIELENKKEEEEEKDEETDDEEESDSDEDSDDDEEEEMNDNDDDTNIEDDDDYIQLSASVSIKSSSGDDNTTTTTTSTTTSNHDSLTFPDGILRPKLLITTRPFPSGKLFYFIADLQKMIPNLHYYPRKHFTMKQIVTFCQNRNYTHLLVLSEKSKQVNGLIVSHLLQTPTRPMGGPTAFFKITNVVMGSDIPGHGRVTHHVPELNLTGLTTRLGHRVGRMLASLFPNQDANFKGRQVVTFHNQRDYLFVRQHRYIFEERMDLKGKTKRHPDDKKELTFQEKMKTRLQELGPRFTLKLRWLQEGTFDTQFGEYEWYHKRKEMDTTRRKFHL